MMISPEQYATGYLKDFTANIYKCTNESDYYLLVSSVFIFSELVVLHFKEFCNFDSNEGVNAALEELKAAAQVVAEKIATESIDNEEDMKGMN